MQGVNTTQAIKCPQNITVKTFQSANKPVNTRCLRLYQVAVSMRSAEGLCKIHYSNNQHLKNTSIYIMYKTIF